MTARELLDLIGKPAVLRTEGMSVPVTIKDAREVFGRLDVLCEPVGGSGGVWCSAERVTLGRDER